MHARMRAYNAESLAIRQRALDLLSPSAATVQALSSGAATTPAPALASGLHALPAGGDGAVSKPAAYGKDPQEELQGRNSEGSWKVWSPKDI